MTRRPHRWFTAGARFSIASSLLLAAPFLMLALVVFILPLLLLIGDSFLVPKLSFANYARAFGEPVYMRVMWRTLKVAVIVTISTLLLAWPLAWAMARSAGFKLTILVAAVLLPLWTSVLVRTYAWIVLLQTTGVINQMLMALHLTSSPVKFIYTEVGVVVAMTHVLLPFMVLPLYSSLKGIPADYTRAAQMLGASTIATFRNVIFPLSAPGMTSGCLMVFLLAIGFYITPALIGGPQQTTVATLISQQVLETLNWPFAGALVGIMFAFVLLLAIIFRRAVSLDRMAGTA